MKKSYAVLFDMKMKLKSLILSIREEKLANRQHTRSMHEFRHLHIARCLIKGRTIEQIEGAVDSHTKKGNPPDMKYVQKLLDYWKPLHETEMVAMKAERQRELEPAFAGA